MGFGVPKRPFPHFCDFSALLRHKTPQVRFGIRVRGFWVVGGVKSAKSALLAQKCTFVPFCLPRDVKNDNVYRCFDGTGFFPDDMAQKCTFLHFWRHLEPF